MPEILLSKLVIFPVSAIEQPSRVGVPSYLWFLAVQILPMPMSNLNMTAEPESAVFSVPLLAEESYLIGVRLKVAPLTILELGRPWKRSSKLDEE